MPFYQPPRTDAERLDFMRKALNAASQDKAADRTYTNDDTITAIQTLAPQMQQAYDTVATQSASRSREIEERNQAYAELELYTRDAIEQLRRQVRRLRLPAQIFQHVGLTLDGSTPKPTTPGEWVTIARALITGEAKAIDTGAQAFCSPSATEIQTILDKVVKEEADVPAADRAFDEGQAALAALRLQADELISEIVAELRYHLRKMDPPSQRRIMRTYGASYAYSPGEPPDPEGEPTPD